MEMSSTDPSGQLVVACFLIQEGCDVTTKNRNGQTPLDLCSPEMAVIAAAFSQRSTRLNNLFSRFSLVFTGWLHNGMTVEVDFEEVCILLHLKKLLAMRRTLWTTQITITLQQ